MKNDDLEQTSAMIAAARRTVVVTGAGISTEAGIPDFRGTGGVYSHRLSAREYRS
jgi:NAD-dependent deacetylase